MTLLIEILIKIEHKTPIRNNSALSKIYMKLSDDKEIFEVNEKNMNFEQIEKRIEKEKLTNSESISKSMLHLRKEPSDKEKKEIHSIFKESISALNTHIKQEQAFYKKKNNSPAPSELVCLDSPDIGEKKCISVKKEISHSKNPKHFELNKYQESSDSFKEIKKILHSYLSYCTKHEEEPDLSQFSETKLNGNFFGDKSFLNI